MPQYGPNPRKKNGPMHKLCGKTTKHAAHVWKEDQWSAKGVHRVVTYNCSGRK